MSEQELLARIEQLETRIRHLETMIIDGSMATRLGILEQALKTDQALFNRLLDRVCITPENKKTALKECVHFYMEKLSTNPLNKTEQHKLETLRKILDE